MVAVLFEKKVLKDSKFLFMPIEILKGEFVQESSTFLTDTGNEYSAIYDEKILLNSETFCFGYEIDLEELNEKYKNKNINDSITDYYDEMVRSLYIGTYMKEFSCIDIISISFDRIDQIMNTGDVELQFLNNEKRISLSIEELEELSELDNIETIHNKIDDYQKFVEIASKTIDCIENNDMKMADKNSKKAQVVSKQEQIEIPSYIEKMISEKKEIKTNINVAELYKDVKSNIISQDEPIKKIINTIAMNYRTDEFRKKSHILITGGSGTGKTEIMRLISKKIDVPLCEADMTKYSVTGYVGSCVEDMLANLYSTSGKNLEAAQNGILILDEIDKKASSRNSDVSQKGVLASLLKILDGTGKIDIEISNGKIIKFNTKNLTVVALGAFEELRKYQEYEMGFNPSKTSKIKEPTIEEYSNFGMGKEFMARFKTIVNMNNLTIEDLIKILNLSAISPLLVNKKVFRNSFNIDINYDDAYIEMIAKKAIKLKTGARSLANIVEESLENAQWEILLNPDKYRQLILTKETMQDNKKYVLK